MKIENFEKLIDTRETNLTFDKDYLLVNKIQLKKLKANNLTIEQKDKAFLIKYTTRTRVLANTWISIINSLIKGLEEPYQISLKKVYRKKFKFYHELDSTSKKIKITLFEKQRKPIIIDYSLEYFKPLDLKVSEEEIKYSCYSKEILGNSVSKLLGIRKGKLLRKDLRKFITGYVRV